MVYLYAGLGVLMLSGIMAIFEMGLSLMGQSLLEIPGNNYLGSREQDREKTLFTASKSLPTGLTGIDICTALQSSSSNDVGVLTGVFKPDPKHPNWKDGCVIEFDTGVNTHQILIAPPKGNINNPYLVLFCRNSDKNSLMCPFEAQIDA